MRYQHQEPETHDQVERRKEETQLSPTITTVFRSCLMRASLLSRDRADLGEAAKKSCSINVETIDEFDGRSQEIVTPLAWQVITGFEM